MKTNRAVAKLPHQKEVRKFGYLKDVYDTSEEEYKKVHKMLMCGCGVDVLQAVVSGRDVIQSILWLDDLITMRDLLIEDNQALIELDKTGVQPLDAYGDATIERNTEDLKRIAKLDAIFASTGFDFIFVEN